MVGFFLPEFPVPGFHLYFTAQDILISCLHFFYFQTIQSDMHIYLSEIEKINLSL